MDSHSDKSSYQQQIYNQMSLKDTEELLDIWKEHDPEAWTDEAFEQVRLILKERLGEVPEPGVDEDEADKEEETELEQRGSERVYKLAYWLKSFSWVVLAFFVLDTVARFVISGAANLGPFLLTTLGNLANYGFIYLLLLAFAEMLYLLEDIHWLMLPGTTEDDQPEAAEQP